MKMSLLEFQRALCDMTLDPVFAASVLRRGILSLAGMAFHFLLALIATFLNKADRVNRAFHRVNTSSNG